MTIIEAPPMVVVGIVGYVSTPQGLRTLTTVWGQHLSDEVKRRFYKNWYKAKKKAFTKYLKKATENKAVVDEQLDRIVQYADVVRVIAHTQVQYVGGSSTLTNNTSSSSSRPLLFLMPPSQATNHSP